MNRLLLFKETINEECYIYWQLSARKAGTFQAVGYSFSPLTGNLMSRTTSTRSIAHVTDAGYCDLGLLFFRW